MSNREDPARNECCAYAKWRQSIVPHIWTCIRLRFETFFGSWACHHTFRRISDNEFALRRVLLD